MLTKPDNGWAWVVMAASFGAHVLHGGFQFSVGMLHVAFLDRFHESVTKTTWAGALFLCLFNAISPFSGILVDKFSCRATMITGSLTMCVGLIGSALLPSLEWIILSFGVVTGIGAGLCYSASVVVIGYNFNKKRNIAYGVAVSGCGIGASISAPLLQTVRDTYGDIGLFFICSGLALHHCVFGISFFPSKLEAERKKFTKQHIHREILSQSPCRYVTNYFNILQNVQLVIFSFSMFFAQLGIYLIYVHLPEYIISTGGTSMHASFLLSVCGLCGTFSRILSGLSANADNIDETVIYVGSVGLMGLSVVLFPLYSTSYYGQIVFVVLFGIYFGAFNPVLGSIIIRIAGLHHLSASFGLIFFTTGIGVFLGPSIAGAIVDSGGTYERSFVVSGISILVGSILGSATVCCKSNENRDYDMSHDNIDEQEKNKLNGHVSSQSHCTISV